jgi:phospholipase C
LVAGLGAGGEAARAAGLPRRRARVFALPREVTPDREQLAALRVLGRTSMRLPDSLPNPGLPEGTDTIPQIEHVVVLMMENHSYDNMLGMLGRGPFGRPRGDGFTISAADGYPLNSNPQADGTPLRAFRMPNTCQLHGKPSQEWIASHEQYAGGANSGFVTSPSGPVAMGYWDGGHMPFFYDLATRFPIADRWFCSLLGQTDPNRRFLIAATSAGMTDDIPLPSQDATLAIAPPNGTIFTRFLAANISWAEYYVQYPSQTSATANLYPVDDGALEQTHGKPFSQFLTDAAAGKLPAFSLVGPNYSTQSQEDPQNIALGEAFKRQVVEALGRSPKWDRTILVITYDEHGGYYDHVPPPVALAPDAIPPVTAKPGQPTYDGFKRYGFRVPTVVVSPYAKPGHVSHRVYDHTSILAFVERKWNLPAMTLRDANANDLSDFLDLEALHAERPTFPEMPALAASGDTPATEACSKTGPGTIPPPRPRPIPIEVALRRVAVGRHPPQVAVTLQASRGELRGVTVELWRGRRWLARRRLPPLGVAPRRVVLRVPGQRHARGRREPAGAFEVIVRHAGRVLVRRHIDVH